MPKFKDTVGLCHAGNSLKCMLCNYEVSSSTGIKLHMKISHNIKNSGANNCSSCFACKKDFDNMGQLYYHLKKEHY